MLEWISAKCHTHTHPNAHTHTHKRTHERYSWMPWHVGNEHTTTKQRWRRRRTKKKTAKQQNSAFIVYQSYVCLQIYKQTLWALVTRNESVALAMINKIYWIVQRYMINSSIFIRIILKDRMNEILKCLRLKCLPSIDSRCQMVMRLSNANEFENE